ncbi:MAG: GIY-YIG nuclease family protein [Pseudomonadota bacterium]
MDFYTYILASQKNGTLYAGHTDDLSYRIHEHRAGRGAAFTRKYNVKPLVWFETHDTRDAAKRREYQIKSWKRAWKIKLIEERNPDWRDLYLELSNL